MKIVKISAQRPERKIIAEAARVIKNGGLVIFPTETVYGLGANAFDARAVRKIFKAKGRPEKKPLIVHVSKKSTLDVLARNIPPVARKLVKKFWPGPLTLVLNARVGLPKYVTGISVKSAIVPSMALFPKIKKRGLSESVAVRMPDHPVALALIRAAGPIAAPSANFSGDKPPRSIQEIPRALLEKTDLVLDAGPTPVGVPSTVIDLTQSSPKVLRHGAISKPKLQKDGLDARR